MAALRRSWPAKNQTELFGEIWEIISPRFNLLSVRHPELYVRAASSINFNKGANL